VVAAEVGEGVVVDRDIADDPLVGGIGIYTAPV
jgi:hypothetical protein